MADDLKVNQAAPGPTTSHDTPNREDTDAIAVPLTQGEEEKNTETSVSGTKAVEIAMEEPETTSRKGGNSPITATIEEPKILRTTAPIDHHDYAKNNKYDASILPVSDDPYEILKQVHFYFGDSNLPSDKFLFEKTGGTSNHPVSLKIVADFKRMKRFQPYETIVAALKESQVLDIIGEEGEEMIKRKVPWKPTEQMKIDARSIYAKGFGDEEPSTQFDIEAFFTPYGPLNSVRLRREMHYFKGSCYVEFSDKETYEKFLAREPKPLWKGKHELLIKPKVIYLEMKNKGIREGEVELKDNNHRSYSRGSNRGGRGRGRGSRDRYGRDQYIRDRHDDHDRGDRDPDNWKQRRENDQANGFKDHRDGRGGRGKGRRVDRGPRNDDRNRERKDNNSNASAGIQAEQDRTKQNQFTEGETKAAEFKDTAAKCTDIIDKTGIQTIGPLKDTNTSSAENEKKRPRQDDEAGEDQPAKKVDTKAELSAAA